MFGFGDVELKQTRFYQDVFKEGRLVGKAKGKAEGKAEGKLEGRVEGEAALLLRLLERKFSPLPESARQRVASADAETLLAWGERVLDANRLDEVWGN
jgi:predicted transposase YdaD